MSALTRSLQYIQQGQTMVDSKAVGAHRPLTRRRSSTQQMPGSPPDSDESSNSSSSGGLFGGDSLTSLSSLMQQLARHQQQQTGRSHRKLDRSQSEPVQQQQVQPSQSNSSRYKTELCRPFEENGTCKYGDKCQFAHGFHELRSLVRHPKYKTELCRTFHTIGFCPYGPRCHFVHNAEEARSNSDPPPPTPTTVAKKGQRGTLFSLPALGTGSTADSPSPPSSLSESPTSMSGTFFGSDDTFGFHSNPFSPSSNSSAAFFGSSLFPSMTTSKKTGQRNINNKFELDSPSPVGSLSSDLDSLSLGASASASPSPPLMNGAGAVMDLSRQLRLPIFSRISETLNED